MSGATLLGDPRLAAVFSFWNQRRGARAMPLPENVDLAGLPSAVQPNAMILDVIRENASIRLRNRRVGKVFWRVSGRDPVGTFVDEALPTTGGYRDYVHGIYQEMVRAARPMYTENIFLLSSGQADPMATKRVSLPLSHDGITVDMVLAAHVFDYRAGGEDAFALVTGLEEKIRAYLDA
jgi:hypothetical protein